MSFVGGGNELKYHPIIYTESAMEMGREDAT